MKEKTYTPSVINYKPMGCGASNRSYSAYKTTYKSILNHSLNEFNYHPISKKNKIFQPGYQVNNDLYTAEKRQLADELFRKKEAQLNSYKPFVELSDKRISNATSSADKTLGASSFFKFFIELVKIFNRWFKK